MNARGKQLPVSASSRLPIVAFGRRGELLELGIYEVELDWVWTIIQFASLSYDD